MKISQTPLARNDSPFSILIIFHSLYFITDQKQIILSKRIQYLLKKFCSDFEKCLKQYIKSVRTILSPSRVCFLEYIYSPSEIYPGLCLTTHGYAVSSLDLIVRGSLNLSILLVRVPYAPFHCFWSWSQLQNQSDHRWSTNDSNWFWKWIAITKVRSPLGCCCQIFGWDQWNQMGRNNHAT